MRKPLPVDVMEGEREKKKEEQNASQGKPRGLDE